MTVEYVKGMFNIYCKPIKRGCGGYLPGQNASGYGSKITTDRVLVFTFGNRRWYRIYAICYSNNSSLFIIKNGERLFIHS